MPRKPVPEADRKYRVKIDVRDWINNQTAERWFWAGDVSHDLHVAEEYTRLVLKGMADTGKLRAEKKLQAGKWRIYFQKAS